MYHNYTTTFWLVQKIHLVVGWFGRKQVCHWPRGMLTFGITWLAKDYWLTIKTFYCSTKARSSTTLHCPSFEIRTPSVRLIFLIFKYRTEGARLFIFTRIVLFVDKITVSRSMELFWCVAFRFCAWQCVSLCHWRADKVISVTHFFFCEIRALVFGRDCWMVSNICLFFVVKWDWTWCLIYLTKKPVKLSQTRSTYTYYFL